jgi:MYXO-CTERM domain-containing protein
VHNAGEVWASVLWEVYVALHKRGQTLTPARTFAESQRLMADVMVASLLLTPPDATYTEARDATLAVLAAGDPGDLAAASEAFARRGLGSCAVAPERASTTFAGATDGVDIKPALAIGPVAIVDAAGACDTDGVLDAGETGRVTFTVANASPIPATDVQVSVASMLTGVSFPTGSSKALTIIPAFGQVEVSFDVALGAMITGIQAVDLAVTVEDAEACVASLALGATVRGNTDDVPAALASDDVESTLTAWTVDGAGWSRRADDALHHHWHGADAATIGDMRLVSPILQVSATAPLVIGFVHRFKFETDPTGPTYYDGAVIEVSTDDGATWQDLSTLVAPGYGGAIATTSGNPLMGRQAFVGQNAAYPQYDTVSLDLGMALAGKAVRLRFRIGTDQASGDEGWSIDDLTFTGIDNKPFAQLVEDQPNVCPTAPVAEAGADQVVAIGATVALDATGSSDANGDALTFAWTQTAGPAVTLLDAASVVAAFKAPAVATQTVLTFQVKVSDGVFASTDTVDVTVLPPPPPDAGPPDAAPPDAAPPDAAPEVPDAAPATPDAAPATPDAAPTGGDDDEGGGCGCTVGGRAPARGLPLGGALATLGLALVLRRRRR